MIRQILAQDKCLVTYRPALREIGGSIAGTVLLQQIIYWDEKCNGKFYKFSEPCSHDKYKDGDSWKEELGMSAKELRTALNHFAFKCGAKNKSKYGEGYNDKRNSSLVQYYTDSHRVTWYMLNRDVLNKLLLGIYKESADTEFTILQETTQETNTENISPSHSPSGSEDKTSAIKSKIFSAVKYDPAAVDLAEMIVASRRRQCPEAKNINKDLEKTRSAWANDLDKMLRIDKRDPAEAKKVLGWALGDSFWEQNIQSGKKFREKYDDLKMRMAPVKGPTGMIEI